MKFKPFDKNFIPSHTIAEQLKALVEKREAAWKEQWIDTVPSSSESTAFDADDLDEQGDA
jgi:hypothetical protein